MKTKNPFWLIISIVMLVSIACASSASSTPTPTSVFIAQPVIVGSGGNAGSGAGGGSGGSGGSGSGGGGSGGNNAVDTQVPTPMPTPDHLFGPYIVQQLESLGHETISGAVCDVAKPFMVNATAPEVSWTFNFAPAAADHGSWTYAYNIPSAGESHDASGSYTISQPDVDGKLLLKMTGSDHVVFTGFDGKFPVNYIFNLVPDQISNCPVNP